MPKLTLPRGASRLALALTLAGLISASAQTPVITSQPQSQSKVLGYPAVVSVSATPTNPPLSYQWRKESVPIPGATGSTLASPNVKYTDAGTYSVLVSNLNGSVASANATFTVIPPVAGDLDFTFNPGSGPNDGVRSLSVQADGKVLIGGDFISVSGMPRNRIARLNADGTLDLNFQDGMDGASFHVHSVAAQGDGKVLIGGRFTTVNGTGRNYIARLNSDGSLDTTFLNAMAGPNSFVFSLALQADGKVLIGGFFTAVNGTGRNHIARLNVDGSLDTSFLNGMGGAGDYLNSVAAQSDGKVLIGGIFTTVNGLTRNFIARLNSNGSLDPTFQNGMTGANDYLNSVAAQADGKVLIGGNFSVVNNVTRNGVARLNSDGSLDPTFQNGMAGANNTVSSVTVQPDGKVLLGGHFTTVNGTSRNRVARLNSDGSLDATFQNGMAGANGTVYSVAAQADGKVLLGGYFTTVNGTSRNRVARLHGTADLYDATDADGDGLANAFERQYGLNPEIPNRQVGTGSAGPLTVTSDYHTDDVAAQVLGSNPAGLASLNVSSTNGFASNDLVMMITMQDANPNLAQNTAGTYEFGRIATVTSNSLTLTQPRNQAFSDTGSALKFDGLNDYVEFDRPVSGDFTIECWFRSSQVVGGETQWYQGRGMVDGEVPSVQNDFGLSLGNGKVLFGTGNPDLTIKSTNALADGKWHHVAATREQATGSLKLFVDGVQHATGTGSTAGLSAPAKLRLGSLASGVGYLNGEIDEVRIWNVVRSQADITNNMRNPLTGSELGLAPYYHLDEGVGTIAGDSAQGNDFDGTLNGPVWTESSPVSPERIQVLKVPEYTDVTVTTGNLTCRSWDGTSGGVLAFLAQSVTLGSNGVISADGKGYRGGLGVPSLGNWQAGISGEGTTAFSTARAASSLERPQGGGGAGKGADGPGGGGGHGSSGSDGGAFVDINGSSSGRGAASFGVNTLSRLYAGGGGGGSGSHSSGRVGVAGGAGGGIVFVAAGSIAGGGTISSRGIAGQAGVNAFDANSGAGGGGGAGGTVYLLCNPANSFQILANGGTGGPHHPSSPAIKDGGAGGVGRIRLDVPASGTVPTSISPALGWRAQLVANDPVTSLIWGPYFDSNLDGTNDWLQFNLWTLQDSDGDGVANLIESQRASDSGNADSDGDGLTDYQELFVNHTDPLKADSDGDGTSDGAEVAAGRDPLSSDLLPSGQYYQYDSLSRLVGVDYANGQSLLYSYDGNDNLLRQAYLSREAGTNGPYSDSNGLFSDSDGQFTDTDGDGYTDGQEWWAGSDPRNATSVPADPLGPAGSNITAGIVFPFTPDNCVVAVGQLDGIGAEEIIVSADGNPSTTTNFLVILSQNSSGWSTQRVDVGLFGVTSLAVGQPANRPSAAIYVGLRQAGGTGRVVEFTRVGGNWTSNTIATSIGDAAFVLGVRAGEDVLASFARPSAPPGSPCYLMFATNTWTTVSANTNASTRGLGTITTPGLHGVAPRGARVLDSGLIQVLGHDVNVPTNAVWNEAYSRWFFITTNSLTWPNAQNFARNTYGGNLATVTDATLDTWVWNQFSSGGTVSFWIGLSRSIVSAPWQWASGMPFNYAGVWAPGEPDGTTWVIKNHLTQGQWADSSLNYRGVAEIGSVERPSVSASQPAASQRLVWKGHSLNTGNLRLTNAVSVLYAFVDDKNLNNVMDAGDDFVVADYQFNGTNLTALSPQRFPMSSSGLAQSYGLASLEVLYGNQQVLFTAEPDGRLFSWSATNTSAPLQRQLFSARDPGKSWHALAGVRTLDPAQSLLGLRVDPASPNRCDVVLWPPLRELPAPPAYPQTAPLTQILPAPNAGTNLAAVDIRCWDAEANPARLTLQYQLPLSSAWGNATIYPDQSVTTHPTGRTHRVYWDALQDLGSGFTNIVNLRAQAQDVSLVGDWSATVAYQVRTFVGNNPQALSDFAITSMNQAVDIDVLFNDTVLNSAPKLIASVELPLYGAAATNANQTVRYTPPTGFVGTDGFGYLLSDGAGGLSWAWVTVTVTDAPLAPIVIESPTMQAGNQFSMMISGPPGQVYQVQVSTNLTDWSAVGTLTNVTGVVPFTEPSTTNASRFYRARLLP